MKEVFTMWRHTPLVVLTALSAAIYAAVLIPFKGFPIVPGFLELRPAILVWVGGVGGAVVGLILPVTSASPMGAGVGLVLIPFLAVILVGAFMLGGREQVEAAHEMMEGDSSEV